MTQRTAFRGHHTWKRGERRVLSTNTPAQSRERTSAGCSWRKSSRASYNRKTLDTWCLELCVFGVCVRVCTCRQLQEESMPPSSAGPHRGLVRPPPSPEGTPMLWEPGPAIPGIGNYFTRQRNRQPLFPNPWQFLSLGTHATFGHTPHWELLFAANRPGKTIRKQLVTDSAVRGISHLNPLTCGAQTRLGLFPPRR